MSFQTAVELLWNVGPAGWYGGKGLIGLLKTNCAPPACLPKPSEVPFEVVVDPEAPVFSGWIGPLKTFDTKGGGLRP